MFVGFWILLFALSAISGYLTVTRGGGPVSMLTAATFAVTALGLLVPVWFAHEGSNAPSPRRSALARHPWIITVGAICFALFGVAAGVLAVELKPTVADIEMLNSHVLGRPVSTWYFALGLLMACGSVAISLATLRAGVQTTPSGQRPDEVAHHEGHAACQNRDQHDEVDGEPVIA